MPNDDTLNTQSIQNDSEDTSTDDTQNPAKVTVDDVKKKIQIEEISEGIFRATTDTSKYIIEYDMNKCIGAASCSAIAPLTFFMNEENKAIIREDVDDFDEDDLILSAAQSCPVFAIKIIEKETGEVLFPLEEMD